MKFILKPLLILLFVYCCGFIINPQFSVIETAHAATANCIANENLNEIARDYISRCRKGSINSEFPGGMYSYTLKAIKSGSSADHKKAWKLLNDKRFAK